MLFPDHLPQICVFVLVPSRSSPSGVLFACWAITRVPGLRSPTSKRGVKWPRAIVRTMLFPEVDLSRDPRPQDSSRPGLAVFEYRPQLENVHHPSQGAAPDELHLLFEGLVLVAHRTWCNPTYTGSFGMCRVHDPETNQIMLGRHGHHRRNVSIVGELGVVLGQVLEHLQCGSASIRRMTITKLPVSFLHVLDNQPGKAYVLRGQGRPPSSSLGDPGGARL